MSQLKELVIKEAKKLKKAATLEEIENLNFKQLDPTKESQCIYGQITGSCFNKRAVKLIQASCKRVYKIDPYGSGAVPFGELNGSPKKTERGNYWSPIEAFIAIKKNGKNGNNKRLIKFLKGKTKTLKLK